MPLLQALGIKIVYLTRQFSKFLAIRNYVLLKSINCVNIDKTLNFTNPYNYDDPRL